jgi:hypothetical protein
MLLSGSLPTEAVAASRLARNARFLLDVAAHEPIPATKTLGNLNRRFVARALDEMVWPDGYIENIRYMNKAVDESDVHKLALLRIALVNARMLRRYRGAFATTKRGRQLLEAGQDGPFYQALWIAYFKETNLAYTDGLPEDPVLQWCAPQIMAAALAAGGGWVSMTDLRHSIVVSAGVWDEEERYLGRDETIDMAVKFRLLEPLDDFGLIELETTRSRGWRQVKAIRATPLLRAFATYDPLPRWEIGRDN